MSRHTKKSRKKSPKSAVFAPTFGDKYFINPIFAILSKLRRDYKPSRTVCSQIFAASAASCKLSKNEVFTTSHEECPVDLVPPKCQNGSLPLCPFMSLYAQLGHVFLNSEAKNETKLTLSGVSKDVIHPKTPKKGDFWPEKRKNGCLWVSNRSPLTARLQRLSKG